MKCIKCKCIKCGKMVRVKHGKPVLHTTPGKLQPICGASGGGADLRTRAYYGAGSA